MRSSSRFQPGTRAVLPIRVNLHVLSVLSALMQNLSRHWGRIVAMSLRDPGKHPMSDSEVRLSGACRACRPHAAAGA